MHEQIKNTDLEFFTVTNEQYKTLKTKKSGIFMVWPLYPRTKMKNLIILLNFNASQLLCGTTNQLHNFHSSKINSKIKERAMDLASVMGVVSLQYLVGGALSSSLQMHQCCPAQGLGHTPHTSCKGTERVSSHTRGMHQTIGLFTRTRAREKGPPETTAERAE